MKIRLIIAALLATNCATAATPIDGWYTNVFGGYAYIPDNVNVLYNNLLLDATGYNGGYNVGGRVGYQSHPLRYELEYTFLHADTKHFEADSVRQTGVTGYTSGNLLMANVYYDFPNMLPTISPFLGGGLGYANLNIALNSAGPAAPIAFSATENVFAYQGTVGLTYNFAENYAVNIAYRYVATDKSDNFGRVFQANLASLSAIYHFDCGNYK